MELSIAEELIEAYGFTADTVSLQQIGSGHINQTYLLSSLKDNKKYILQNINTEVFKEPFAIANNIKAVADYLKEHYPDYLFPAPITTLNGDLMAHHDNGYWRLLPFVEDTSAFDTLSETKQAYEAAKQFGKLSRLLNEFDTSILSITIPGFHDLAWRYEQFTFALNQAATNLKITANEVIETALHHHFIIDYYRSYERSKEFPDRVMHHDTKISNVLLSSSTNSGVCVIDLDTLMQVNSSPI